MRSIRRKSRPHKRELFSGYDLAPGQGQGLHDRQTEERNRKWCPLAGLPIGAAVTRVESASAGVFINIEPLVGATLGIGVFGDPAGWPLPLGGVLIVRGSIIVVRGERVDASRVADATHGLSLD